MSVQQAKNIAKEYAKKLTKNRFLFERVYLFGSQATGKSTRYSDIDIAVVSKRPGHGKMYTKRKIRLWLIAHDVDSRIEPVLLSPSDIKEKTASIIGDQVRQYGIRVVK